MKLRLSIESGRHLPGHKRGELGGYVAWAELDGVPVSGALAVHSERQVAELQASAELARRLRRLIDPLRAAEATSETAETAETAEPDADAAPL